MNRARDAKNFLLRLPAYLDHKRVRRGLSYRKAAEEIGIAHGFLHGIISGTKEPGHQAIIKCLTWLEVP